jgi:SAM-dependent methyltransferase
MRLHEQIWLNDYRWRVGLNMESDSGVGSCRECVKEVIKSIPIIFSKYKIKTMLDIPCGDYNWMSVVDLRDVKYTGCDVVEEQIENNRKKYRNIDFKKLDIIYDLIEYYDIIFTRDCFIHLPFSDIFKSINNIIKSESKYFMCSTYIDINHNDDLDGAIGYRPLNMTIEPFNFQEPILLVKEDNSKCMGLWSISDLRRYAQ